MGRNETGSGYRTGALGSRSGRSRNTLDPSPYRTTIFSVDLNSKLGLLLPLLLLTLSFPSQTTTAGHIPSSEAQGPAQAPHHPAHRNHFTDQWAVHIVGGTDKAHQIANKHGFVNTGEVRTNIACLCLLPVVCSAHNVQYYW